MFYQLAALRDSRAPREATTEGRTNLNLQLDSEMGGQSPAARGLLCNFNDIVAVPQHGFPGSKPTTYNQKNTAFFAILTTTEGYGPALTILTKGHTQLAKPKLAKENGRALSTLMDTFRTTKPQEWTECFLPPECTRAHATPVSVGAVGSVGAGDPAAGPLVNPPGLPNADALTDPNWYKTYDVTGFRYWRP